VLGGNTLYTSILLLMMMTSILLLAFDLQWRRLLGNVGLQVWSCCHSFDTAAQTPPSVATPHWFDTAI
jgi:hypothetical protein